jgi:hypothetical protein
VVIGLIVIILVIIWLKRRNEGKNIEGTQLQAISYEMKESSK